MVGEGLGAELRCPQETALGSSLPTATPTPTPTRERPPGPAERGETEETSACPRESIVTNAAWKESSPKPRAFPDGAAHLPVNSHRQTGAAGGSTHGGHDGHSGGRWSRLSFLRWQCWRRTGIEGEIPSHQTTQIQLAGVISRHRIIHYSLLDTSHLLFTPATPILLPFCQNKPIDAKKTKSRQVLSFPSMINWSSLHWAEAERQAAGSSGSVWQGRALGPTASECTPRPRRPNFHGFHQASDWAPSSYPNGTVYFSGHAASAHRITSQGRVPEKQKITYYRPPECQGGGAWGARPPHRHCPGAARPTATWRLSCSGSPPRDPSEGARTG